MRFFKVKVGIGFAIGGKFPKTGKKGGGDGMIQGLRAQACLGSGMK